MRAAFPEGGDRARHAYNNRAGIEWLDKIIERAALHRFHGAADIVIAGYDEYWCGVILRIEFFERRYTGFTGQMQIEQYAGGYDCVLRRERTRCPQIR